jgi:probable F420-dependent oxidoreductase
MTADMPPAISPDAAILEDVSCYILAGQKVDPTHAVPDAVAAEALGIGTAWLSEKWGQKDCAVLLGAMSAATSTIRLGAGVTHPHTRHPLLLANFGATMQAISGGRFLLGIGRGAGRPWGDLGLPVPTLAMLRDTALLLRRLWAGEKVSYNGAAGAFPALRLENRFEGPPPPLGLAATGPRTLALAGEIFDVVLTQPYLNQRGVAQTVEVVRFAATTAGRDPNAVRVVQTLVVAPDLAPQRQQAIAGGRLVRYLQAPHSSAALLPALNGWDPAVIERIREHPILTRLRDRNLPPELRDDVLAEVASDVVPANWIKEGAAVGSTADCVAAIQRFRTAGSDEILLHGLRPEEASELVDALHRVKRERQAESLCR